MSFRKLIFPLALLTVFYSVSAGDIDSIRFPEKAWDSRPLYFLQKGPRYLDKDLVFDLPSPPSNSSLQTQNELKLLQQYARENRTEDQINKINIEAKHGDFSEIYIDNSPFNETLKQSVPFLLSLANKEAMYFIVREKKRFSRPRPSQLDEKLELLIPNPGHPAYPSGHATQSMLFSEILSDIDPENRLIYIQYAKDIAVRREIAGVHYPSDSDAGQKLAVQLWDALKQVPDFNQALTKSKDNYNNTVDSTTP